MQKEWWEQQAGESQEHPRASEPWLDVGKPQGRARGSRDSPILPWHLEWLCLELLQGLMPQCPGVGGNETLP